MSITITQQPSGLTSASNDCVYVVSGSTNNISLVDYKYVAQVFFNNNQVATLKSFPDPTLGYGYFNLKTIAPSFLSPTFNDTLALDMANPIGLAPTSAGSFYLSIGEEYINPALGIDSQFIQNFNLAQTSGQTYFNGALSFNKQVNFNPAQYTLGNSNSLFLTDYQFGFPKLAYPQMRQWLYFYSPSGVTTNAFIQTFDINGTQLGGYIIPMPSSQAGIYYVISGVPQLAALTTGQYSVDSGQSPMMQANVDSYQITMYNINTIVSQTFKFKVTQDCANRWAPYANTVHWMNQYGAIDSFYFNREIDVTNNVTQGLIKQNYGRLTNTGTFDIRSSERGIRQHYTMSEDEMVAATDFVKQEDMSFLKGLQTSPLVWMEPIATGQVSAAYLNGDPYVIPKRIKERLFAAKFTFRVSMQNYGQNQ